MKKYDVEKEWLEQEGAKPFPDLYEAVYLASEVDARLSDLGAELQQQARLNGAGGEREATHLTRIAELRRLLLKYGRHEDTCDFIQDTLPCTCGFEDLRKSL